MAERHTQRAVNRLWQVACCLAALGATVTLTACSPKKSGPGPTEPTPTATGTTPAPTATTPPDPPPTELEKVQQQLVEFCGCDASAGPPRPELSPQAPPRDVSLQDVGTCSTRQTPCHSCFSCFGWQLFLTLNWPADGGSKFGAPGATAPVIWEAYKGASEVFSKSVPTAWGSAAPKRIVATSAVIHLTEALQADNNWLTDRSGNVVYYESRVNEDEFEYIVANKLYSQQGLYQAFTTGTGLSLPDGSAAPYEEGAIEVKAAWRIVPEAERAAMESRYKLSTALIGDAPNPVTVALIGLHIAKKTPSSPQWVWATFEHEDNAPDAGAADPSKSYNLYDPALAATYRPNQSDPPSKFDSPATPRTKPVQVSRLTPISAVSQQLNALMSRLIKLRFADSVFQHYQLIDVQWAKEPQATQAKPTAPLPTGSPMPATLANVAMESYMQEKNSGGGALYLDESSPDYGKSSCIGCHATAAITPTFAGVTIAPGAPRRWFTDYSALFFRAQKHPN